MAKKCPNCGYNCNDNDAFCAMCGVKLEFIEQLTNDEIDVIDSRVPIIEEDEEPSEDETTIKNKKTFNFNPNVGDSGIFSFVLVMILISLLLSFSLYLIIKKQDLKKAKMRFNTMVTNPALIPELKEPSTFFDLKTNLKSNEYFLNLYLKYSDDAEEKKEQIFISYLKEMDKLPHLTNENILKNGLDVCSDINTLSLAEKCVKRINSDLENIGVSAYSDNYTIYLYPNYEFIYKKYNKYVSNQMKSYLKLKAKYNVPASVGLSLKLKPKKIANKIFDFENLYTKVSDVYIREQILSTIYYDFRTFIFLPSIYATTTQEMKKEFKNAYLYFINTSKETQLRSIIMCYLDKMRAYSEENFKSDYPYEIPKETFEENVENSTFSDIFIQLRKNLLSNVSQVDFLYIYSFPRSSWQIYNKNSSPSQGEYLLSAPDENSNISIYNNTLSQIQELNIPKYSKLFLANGNLYIFNFDRLNMSKIIFNGVNFYTQQLNLSDVTSIFPGIRVINIDSYRNYDIYIEKENQKCTYIILSRYSQGFKDYKITPIEGKVSILGLPNMFTISDYTDTILSYHNDSVNPKETSEVTPTYKITIHTPGYQNETGVVNYDEKTANEEHEEEAHNPVMMPKILKDKIREDNSDINTNLQAPPQREIEPPKED